MINTDTFTRTDMLDSVLLVCLQYAHTGVHVSSQNVEGILELMDRLFRSKEERHILCLDGKVFFPYITD